MKIIYFPNGKIFQIQKAVSDKKAEYKNVTKHPCISVIFIKIDFFMSNFSSLFKVAGTFEVIFTQNFQKGKKKINNALARA